MTEENPMTDIADIVTQSVDVFVDRAIDKLEARLGKGILQEKPELLAAYLTCCNSTMQSMTEFMVTPPDFETDGLFDTLISENN